MSIGAVSTRNKPAGLLRLVGLDRLRGLAIGCMIVDHVALLGGLQLVRVSVGRLALPIFFVLAGALVRRLTWRHGAIFAVGLVLPVVVPWIDSPNVLTLYAVGAVVLVAGARWWWWPWVVLVVAVTLLANGWGDWPAGGYPPAALLALLAAGTLLRRYVGLEALHEVGEGLPGWLGAIGRRPVTWYVGHLLVLQGLVVMVL